MGCFKLAPFLQQQTKTEISGGDFQKWKLSEMVPLETAGIN